MSYQILGKNIQEAQKIIRDLKKITYNLKYSDPRERSFYLKGLDSLMLRLNMINNAIPSLVESISIGGKMSPVNKNVINVSYSSPSDNEKSFISIKKEDKEKFLKELSLSDNNINKISSIKKEVRSIRPSVVAEISNKFFGKISSKFKGSMADDLRIDLKKANSRFLLETYISIALFFSSSVFLLSLITVILCTIFVPSTILFIWIPFVALFFSLVGFYLFPSFEKSAIEKNVSNELPFAIIYMSAISGVNVDPTKIFKLVSDSPEYPNVGIEMRKVINQIEMYGYDLVTALKSVSKITTNVKLAQLLNGMATNISSGSSLKNFLEKESDNLLADYKLDREKYNSVATTFMDVYISVLITAPLIMVMLVVIMNLTNMSVGGLSSGTLIAIAIGMVALFNVIFLIFLQIKQPKV